MGNILGMSAGHHDAALTLVDPYGYILFAGHSERYSRIKNDPNIDIKLIEEVTKEPIGTVAYYERPWAKQLRHLLAGQPIEWRRLTTAACVEQQLGCILAQNDATIESWNHHLSHAAAGFQTSSFNNATVVVIDAIGELETITIWEANYDANGTAQYKLRWRQWYPHSIGLFYSAVTKHVGLKPNEDEYILMGMSSYGESNVIQLNPVDVWADAKFNENFHRGMQYSGNLSNIELAKQAQLITERLVDSIMYKASTLCESKNLVYSGGVALNCLANRLLGRYFDDIWIMPCPGDAGSSLGAAALSYGKKLHWMGPYLGHISSTNYPVEELLNSLLEHQIVGVCSGAAEFGPRALGNRSLLADPRHATIKERVNTIKQRQQFRPFAPVILEEFLDDNFVMPHGWKTSPYMQVVAQCKHPELYPAVVHVDGTSRVQTVSKSSTSGIRKLLERWFEKTGCPMLLNTSLNIKGEPMVNTIEDAKRFTDAYSVKVFW